MDKLVVLIHDIIIHLVPKKSFCVCMTALIADAAKCLIISPIPTLFDEYQPTQDLGGNSLQTCNMCVTSLLKFDSGYEHMKFKNSRPRIS